MEVRDPIHGAIHIGPEELAVVDHPFVQRLRHIRATGFSHLPFPGATHSRYAHSLGAMHLAGEAFDHAFRHWHFHGAGAHERFRATVRLAGLCHDLGHAPLSHSTEFAMPQLPELGITFYDGVTQRRATHEDYTIAILERSGLREVMEARFPCTTRHVAALISDEVPVDDDFFVDGGLDHRRVLSQLISSELDTDRLDYLVRDSYHTGARYGQIDVGWLLSNLVAHPVDDEVVLALDGRAIYAFDDFLIARHHMFLMVYFHHKSVVYEEMLKRYVEGPGCNWSVPSDLEGYLWADDVALEHHLRQADDPWARRVVEGRPFRRVMERHGTPDEVDLSSAAERLAAEGLEIIHTASTGALSRYHVGEGKRSAAPDLYVVHRMPGMPVESSVQLSEASRIFQRYADARRIGRIYVRPDEVDRARRVLGLPVG